MYTYVQMNIRRLLIGSIVSGNRSTYDEHTLDEHFQEVASCFLAFLISVYLIIGYKSTSSDIGKLMFDALLNPETIFVAKIWSYKNDDLMKVNTDEHILKLAQFGNDMRKDCEDAKRQYVLSSYLL